MTKPMTDPPISERIILDLCGGTGAWSRPYAGAGYDVRLVTLPDQDVRTYEPPERVWGVLAAPPCTEFARCGARWWKTKPPHLLKEAVDVVNACLRIIEAAKPMWWALENPVGRLEKFAPFLGAVKFRFQPWEFGDPWTKQTWLWGEFSPPVKLADAAKPQMISVPGHRSAQHKRNIHLERSLMDVAVKADWIHKLGPDRARLRSITPPGFARTFFEANP